MRIQNNSMHIVTILSIGIQQPRYLSFHLRPEALRPFLSKGLLFLACLGNLA